MTTTIDFDYFEFNQQMYRTRALKSLNGASIVVAEYSLFQDMSTFFGGDTNPNFQAIDDNFVYYATDAEIELTDDELLLIIYPESVITLRVTANDVLSFDKSLTTDEVREVLCALENDMQIDSGNIRYWVDEVVAKRQNEKQLFSKGDDRASIGFFRGDGDFELLATLNNGGEQYSHETFAEIVQAVLMMLNQGSDAEDIVALHREDALDIISMDDE